MNNEYLAYKTCLHLVAATGCQSEMWRRPLKYQLQYTNIMYLSQGQIHKAWGIELVVHDEATIIE